MSKKSSATSKTVPTTPSVVSRVQSAVAKKSGGAIPKGSYVGRLQSTADSKSLKSGSQ